jgi:hypothetical protein
LKSLLELEARDSLAIDGIREHFREEAAAALPVLRRYATAAAGEEGVKRVVGRRFGLYPQPERSDGLWAAWWADYIDTCSDVPESALEAGMQAWVKQLDAEFLPKPGALRALALKTPNRAARALSRVEAALGGSHPAITHGHQPQTREMADKAEVAEMLASFKAQRVPPAPRPVVPAFQPPVDEHGVSPELRGIQERR